MSMINQGKHFCRTLSGFKVPRFRDVFGQFCIMADILCEYLLTLGIVENSTKWKESIFKQINEYQNGFAETDVLKMIARAINETISRFGTKCLEDLTPKSIPTSIFYDSKFYYVRAEGLLQMVSDFYRLNGRELTLNKEQLIQILKENEMLQTFQNSKGNIESARKLGQSKGVHTRYLYIWKEKIKELLDD